MSSILSAMAEFIESEAVRYVAATGFGFVLGFLAEWLQTRRVEIRQARVLRHALADELTHNLDSLWRMKVSFERALAEGDYRWPNVSIATFALDQAIHPEVGSLLTEREQGFAHKLRRDLDTMVVEEEAIKANREKDRDRVMFGYGRMVSNYLPVNGSTAIQLLTFVLKNQGSFPSSETQAMAVALRPTLENYAGKSSYLWLSSQIPRAKPGDWGRSLVVWQNDQPDQVPKGVRLIELGASFGSDNRVINFHDPSTGLRSAFTQWQKRREISRGVRLHKQSKKD